MASTVTSLATAAAGAAVAVGVSSCTRGVRTLQVAAVGAL